MENSTNHTMRPTMDTARLHLRHFNETDAQDVFEYASDEQTIRYLTWPAHKTIEESRIILHTLLCNPSTYAIVLKETNKVIGCVDLRIGAEIEASFGYVLNRAYWNNGYMSEALHEVLSYMFGDLGIESVESCHERENPASGAVMKKCGMQWTHLAEQEMLFGKTSDNDHYRITREMWQDFIVASGSQNRS